MTLEALRAEITRTDKEIIRLIEHRQDLAGRIAKIKIHEGRPVHDEQRTAEVLKAILRSIRWLFRKYSNNSLR
jgi:chorismate mutase